MEYVYMIVGWYTYTCNNNNNKLIVYIQVGPARLFVLFFFIFFFSSFGILKKKKKKRLTPFPRASGTHQKTGVVNGSNSAH